MCYLQLEGLTILFWWTTNNITRHLNVQLEIICFKGLPDGATSLFGGRRLSLAIVNIAVFFQVLYPELDDGFWELWEHCAV